jgi:glycerol-3-phosphate acyltransferase PlsY
MTLVIWIAAAYVIGAVPFGVIVARARGVDIMATGSGNIGATNVGRTLGAGPGLLVLGLDIAKGLVPAAIASMQLGRADQALLVGVAAVIGHSLSPFLRFRGGKGVATGLGALLGSAPGVAGVALVIFCVVFVLTRWVSLSSLVAVAALPIVGWARGEPPLSLGLYAAMTCFVFYRHRANIGRLSRGEEPRFTFRRREEP